MYNSRRGGRVALADCLMGYSTRAFKVAPNGELRRFSYARFRRLWDRDALDSLPENAGSHTDFAIVSVSTHERGPVKLKNLELIRLQLDASGRFGEEQHLRHLAAAGGLVQAWHEDQSRQGDASSILPAANRFARKQHDREFSWEPSEAQWQALAAFIDAWPLKAPRV